MKVCSVEGCDKEAKVKGMCSAHYQKQRRDDNLSINMITPSQAVDSYTKAEVIDLLDTMAKGFGEAMEAMRKDLEVINNRISETQHNVRREAVRRGEIV